MSAKATVLDPEKAAQRLADMRDFFQARKILQQSFWWDAADIEINIRVAAHEEERRLHPEWAATVRQQDFEVRKIYCDIVHVNGIAKLVACARED